MRLVPGNRVLITCGLLLGGLAGFGYADDALDCATYISSSIEDVPMTGFLLGEEDRSMSFSIGTKAEPLGVGGSTSGTYTISWSVGYYWMSDGSILRIDCRNYTVV